MKVVRYISFWILLLSVCLPAMAQEFFSGRVVDASTREPVIGAAVTQDDAWDRHLGTVYPESPFRRDGDHHFAGV